MQFKQAFRVLGAKRSKGEFEGRAFDKTILRVQMEVSDNRADEVGLNVADMVYGKSDNFDKVKGFPYPCDLVITVNLTDRGYEVADVHGLAQPPKAA